MFRERKRKLIIVHPSPIGTLAFDIFCPKDEIPPELNDFGYRVEECPYVKEYGVEDYVASEDLGHILILNKKVLETIFRLIQKGFEVEFKGFEDEPKVIYHE